MLLLLAALAQRCATSKSRLKVHRSRFGHAECSTSRFSPNLHQRNERAREANAPSHLSSAEMLASCAKHQPQKSVRCHLTISVVTIAPKLTRTRYPRHKQCTNCARVRISRKCSRGRDRDNSLDDASRRRCHRRPTAPRPPASDQLQVAQILFASYITCKAEMWCDACVFPSHRT